MPDQGRTDKVKKQLEKISYLMQRFENTAREEISSREDYLQVCGAMPVSYTHLTLPTKA